ncbi:MAG TPA: NHLP bacteriocin export ABC transporter permease/ATPase subunit, partial [Longimicrobium sp.]|nr:NHLP bacteriocin export ABC transporter permease/ATPase subunit [Longimicrobium sp.]
LFAAEGASAAAGADPAFLLGGETAWVVESGRLDLFAVRVHEGEPFGVRRHLVRLEAGEPLFALGPLSEGGIALLAVGSTGTRLRALPQSRLRTLYDGGDAAVRHALGRWVASLCAGLARDVVPRRCEDLDPGATRELADGESVRPTEPVWLHHPEGASLLVGEAALRLEGGAPVPVAPPAWITASGAARVSAGEAPSTADEAWAGLARLHGLVLAAAAEIEARAVAADRDRLLRRAALDASVLARACGRLVSVLDTARPGGPGMRLRDADGGEDALFAASRLVGDAAGIAVRPPPPSGAGGLLGIARASRFHVRRVMLRDDWWTRDGGPVLAFVEEGRRPVALLPVRGARYVLCDPAARCREPVDAKVAGTLSPFAWAFYRAFAPEPLTLPGVLRFAARGCGRDLGAVLATGAAGGLLATAVPIATGVLFNSVIPSAERGQLLQLTAVLLAVAVAAGLFQLTRAIALTRMEGKMGPALQAAVWDRLLALPPTFFRSWTAGDLASRAMGVDAVRQALSGAAVTAMVGLLFAAVHFALLFRYSVRLALWATLLGGVALGATALAGGLQLKRQRVLARVQAEIEGLVLQLLTGIAKLKVAAAEARAFGLWAERFAEQRRIRFSVRRIGSVLAVFQAAFPIVASLVVFWAAAGLVEGGEATFRTGDFLAFLAAFGIFTTSLVTTSQAVVAGLAALPQFENARPILSAPPEVGEARADPGRLRGEVAVQHVYFRYAPDAPYILHDLSLSMGAGEFVALVGPSGSGKSTLLRLLLGFEQPESGSIFFDGQELSGLDVNAVRRQIGVVLQDGRLMPGDVFTNIVGSSGASLDDAWEAARMAGLDADVKAMPMGMHTVVSEGGTTLSGGQRQRLMIARAVVTRPRILLFDEATSALDNRTQAIVSEALAQLRATRLVVAHRLSTIVHADQICVVQGGTIVQRGRYGELMSVAGPFAELAKRQIA